MKNSPDDYMMNATLLQDLYGQELKIRRRDSGELVRFEIQSYVTGQVERPRVGLEGYGLNVNCYHPQKGKIASFLKVFKYDVPERRQRSRFLYQLGLAKHHDWLFKGLPYAILPMTRINNVHIVGHIAQRILDDQGQQAPNLKELLEGERWNYSTKQRRRFCGEICCAVVTLEGLSMIHGDISLGNVLIGTNPKTGKAVATLCDFDAFYHPTQSLLPLKYRRRPTRPAGALGFQYPALLEQIEGNDPDVCVRTDRFALGVAVCQMMVWDNKLSDQLKREELLTTEIIKARDLGRLPGDLRDRWPVGFGMLQSALEAKNIDEIPGPRQWLEAVGGPPPPVPVIHTRKRRPKARGARYLEPPLARLKSASGTLGAVHAELGPVSFERRGQDVLLSFAWEAPVLKKSFGGIYRQLDQMEQVKIQPGESITSNGWELEVKMETTFG